MSNRLLKALFFINVFFLSFAHADTFPSKIIRIVEPAGPGSAVDNAARYLTQGLSLIHI